VNKNVKFSVLYTHVVANWVGSVDGGDHMENFRFRKNYFSWMKNIKVIPKGFI